jgi:hypothetical protein
MNFKNYLAGVLLLLFITLQSAHAQHHYDTLLTLADSSEVKMMAYPVKNGQVLLFKKPQYFGFVTQLPHAFVNLTKTSFNKKALPAWAMITAGSLGLIAYDQKIINGVQQFSNYIGLDGDRNYKSVLSFNLGSTKVNAYDFPQNFNSVLYSIGEGSTSIFICGGLFAYGKIKNDYRSLQTSCQILQSQLAVGIVCQLLKRVSGRESPFSSTEPGGAWHPFTNWGTYQKNVSHYDAFPSGHLATMMATFVVISENYPEKRWIKPLGYTLMGLSSFAMINNGVHWAGDYPLALGIGYVCGKVAVNMNRMVFKRKYQRK